MMDSIEIEVSPEGEVKYHVRGIRGKSCKGIERLLASVLGEVRENEYTQEAKLPEQVVEVRRRGSG